MILFEKIRWKNFLSTGNQFTEVSLCDKSTTLIIGTNGTGKSTILDALTFSLFAKPFRKINKPQLLNSVNEKDCLVEIEFKISNVSWKLIRGIKPNKFEIWKNGELLDQASSAVDQQKWFEQNVLKMNYKSFTQIVILGSSTFVPFMQLTAANRREVIEDLLDIRIFSNMNSVIKDKIRNLREDMKISELKKTSMSEKYDMQKKFIEKIERDSEFMITTKNNRIRKLEDEMCDHIKKIEKYNDEIVEKQVEFDDWSGDSGKLKKLNVLRGKISQKIDLVVKEHKFFTNNTVCPTCTQSINEDFRINRIKDAQDKSKELQSGFIDLEEAIKEEEERERQLNSITREITNLTHGISTNNVTVSEIRKQIKCLESEIQGITRQVEDKSTETEKLSEFEQKLDQCIEDISNIRESINYYDFSYNLLKDGGVKTKIVKKYLPLINQQVNRYLQLMDFYINFSLDEEFNESIQSPIHDNFSYASFSEGEKMRIDLALLFTWREVAAMKNSVNTNLLIMDEVFDSSLDGFGTEEFLKIIKFVVKDANIFVISHKESLFDKFDGTIKFEKIKGFSRMVTS